MTQCPGKPADHSRWEMKQTRLNGGWETVRGKLQRCCLLVFCVHRQQGASQKTGCHEANVAFHSSTATLYLCSAYFNAQTSTQTCTSAFNIDNSILLPSFLISWHCMNSPRPTFSMGFAKEPQGGVR